MSEMSEPSWLTDTATLLVWASSFAMDTMKVGAKEVAVSQILGVLELVRLTEAVGRAWQVTE